MKVLHVLDRSFPNLSGYASRANYIIQNQKDLGVKPVVLTSPGQAYDSELEVIDDVPYYRMKDDKSEFNIKLPVVNEFLYVRRIYKKIIEIIEKENIDILHAHSPALLGLACLIAGRKRQLKVVYEIRAFWEDAAVASGKYSERSTKYKSVKFMESFVCRHVDKVVTIANHLKNDLIARGISPSKIFVVPNGVDSAKFHPVPKDEKLVIANNLKDKIVIGYVGTFFDFEGIEDLFLAMSDICKERQDVAFLLVGGGESEAVVRTLFKRENNDQMCYVGKVPHQEVLRYYSVMDVLAYPRKSKRVTELTTPLKPLEALSMGKPIICSNVGGLQELVGEGNALFFTPAILRN